MNVWKPVVLRFPKPSAKRLVVTAEVRSIGQQEPPSKREHRPNSWPVVASSPVSGGRPGNNSIPLWVRHMLQVVPQFDSTRHRPVGIPALGCGEADRCCKFARRDRLSCHAKQCLEGR
jgi:hypothetical protein